MIPLVNSLVCKLSYLHNHDINEDIRNKRENLEKWKGYANKISYISAARCSILPMWYQINA